MTPSGATTGTTTQNQDNEELAKFRQEWLDELKRRRNAAAAAAEEQAKEAGPSVSSSSTGETSKGPLLSPTRSTFAKKVPADVSARKRHDDATIPESTPSSAHPALTSAGIVDVNLSPSMQNALNIYRQAVEHERNGDLDEALLLYRRAFRIDDNVDRAFRREEKLKAIINGQTTAVTSPKSRAGEVDELSGRFEKVVSVKDTETPTTVAVATGTLVQLIKDFPPDVNFEPLEENEPVHLKVLPDELLVSILKRLDHSSIESFGSVSRKARLLTLDSGVWRPLVKLIYRPPQIPEDEDLIEIMERRLYDYRRVFIEQPRVRMDGVYIAICHYIRPGLSDNRWVNVSHLVTYHRYLRFYPSGHVLSLLVNEEHGPQQVIPILKPTLRMKGFFIGTWKLDGTTVFITDLIEADGRYIIPHRNISGEKMVSDIESRTPAVGQAHAHNTPAAGYAKYTFGMMLSLKSRPLGRWNRMEILEYESVKMDTGDVEPISLKQERPYWFSKVKSYGFF